MNRYDNTNLLKFPMILSRINGGKTMDYYSCFVVAKNKWAILTANFCCTLQHLAMQKPVVRAATGFPHHRFHLFLRAVSYAAYNRKKGLNGNFLYFLTFRCPLSPPRRFSLLGSWSARGCRTVPVDSFRTKCICDRLSTFAILARLNPDMVSRPLACYCLYN